MTEESKKLVIYFRKDIPVNQKMVAHLHNLHKRGLIGFFSGGVSVKSTEPYHIRTLLEGSETSEVDVIIQHGHPKKDMIESVIAKINQKRDVQIEIHTGEHIDGTNSHWYDPEYM